MKCERSRLVCKAIFYFNKVCSCKILTCVRREVVPPWPRDSLPWVLILLDKKIDALHSYSGTVLYSLSSKHFRTKHSWLFLNPQILSKNKEVFDETTKVYPQILMRRSNSKIFGPWMFSTTHNAVIPDTDQAFLMNFLWLGVDQEFIICVNINILAWRWPGNHYLLDSTQTTDMGLPK